MSKVTCPLPTPYLKSIQQLSINIVKYKDVTDSDYEELTIHTQKTLTFSHHGSLNDYFQMKQRWGSWFVFAKQNLFEQCNSQHTTLFISHCSGMVVCIKGMDISRIMQT